MGNAEPEFEITDSGGTRHRWKRADGYEWQWGLKSGTYDVYDHDIVEVTLERNDELIVFLTYVEPISVGNVTEDDCLKMPERQVEIERCPKCGFSRRI